MATVYLPGYDPGNPNDLLVPMARIFIVPQNPRAAMRAMIDELPYQMGGRASKPNAPVILRMIDGSTTIIPGFGHTEASELQDMAYQQLEKHRDDWRERFDFPDRQSFDSRIREHMDWRIKHPNEHPQPMNQLEREARRRQIPNV